MQPRTARRIAWSLVVVYITLATIGLTLQILTDTYYSNNPLPVLIIAIVLAGMWPVIGARIISRHPRHPVGWLLCLGIIGASIDMFAFGYVAYDIHAYSGSLPGMTPALVWLSLGGVFPFATTAFTLILLLFPDGHLPSPGQRVIAWAAVGTLLFYLPLQALEPGPVDPSSGIFLSSPLGVSPSLWAYLRPLLWTAYAMLALCNLAAVIALVFRLRRAQGDERQQIKWLVYPAALFWLSIPFDLLGIAWDSQLIAAIGVVLGLPAVIGIVIAVAFAIFKYRLYDIDLIVNRSLVYGALTASVAGLYMLIVGGAGLVIQGNTLVASVLITAVVVVGAFRPMRTLLQRGADRMVPIGRPNAGILVVTEETVPGRSAPDLREKAVSDAGGTETCSHIVRLSLGMRPLLRAMWFFWAAAALSIIILNIASQFGPVAGSTVVGMSSTAPRWTAARVYLITTLIRSALSIICLVLAAVLYFKRPKEGMALLVSYLLLATAVVTGPLAFLEPFLPGADALPYSFIQPLIFVPLLIAFLSTFPDGRPVPSWTQWLIAAAIFYAPVSSVLFTTGANSEPAPIYIGAVLFEFVFIFAGFYAQIYRYRHVSNAIERQQTKWIIYGFALMVLFASFMAIWSISSSSPPEDTSQPWWSALLHLGWVLSYSILPISLTLAVMRYRLFDIDLIINRTLVYGTLTAGVALFYVLVVSLSGFALQTGSNLAALLLATAVIAALFRPIQVRLQGGVDRLISPHPFERSALETPAPSNSGLAPGPEPSVETLVQPASPAGAKRLEMDTGSEGPGVDPAVSSRHWLRLARSGWLFLAAMAVILLILAIPGYLLRRPMGNLGDRLIYDPTPFMLTVHRLNLAGSFIAVLLSFGLAAVLFRKRKDDPMALFMAYYLIVLVFSGLIELLEPFWPDAVAVNSFILLPLISFPMTMILLAIFPDGRFVPPWTRRLLPFTPLLAPLTASQVVSPGLAPSDPLSWALIVAVFIGLGAIILALIWAQIYRYRHVSVRLQRQQTKWVFYGFLVMIGLYTLGSGPWGYALTLPPGTPMPWWVPPAETTWVIASAILPVTLTLSILRYRLYDVDILINRTLVYGTLTITIVVVYALLVGALGTLLQTGGNLAISFVATGLIAVLFQPLRERLQRAVNRLTYGERDEPFEALARLGRRLESVFSPEMVYPTIVETVAQALKLPYAAIAVKRGEGFETVEAYGKATREPVAYPLIHQGEVVGQLLVGRRSPDEEFGAADDRLLRSIARQAGTAVHAAQLTADLQRSRQQLVTTREEERLRLRRDLHDGLGPALASVAWQAESARDLVYSSPEEAVQLLNSSIEQAQAALTDIRRLVYGLRPPALDELGLVGALEQATRRHQQTDVTIKAPTSLPSLPAAVEVAAYRIVQEALKNAVDHGKAEHCLVNLAIDGNLCLSVSDDGSGLPEAINPGVGLISMRERAEELGGAFAIHQRAAGGTEVEVCLPLELEGEAS